MLILQDRYSSEFTIIDETVYPFARESLLKHGYPEHDIAIYDDEMIKEITAKDMYYESM